MKLSETSNVTDALPEQLVATASSSWWARWVGTWTFNAIALVTLVAISSFVVLSPSSTGFPASSKPKAPPATPRKQQSKNGTHGTATTKQPTTAGAKAKAPSSERFPVKTVRASSSGGNGTQKSVHAAVATGSHAIAEPVATTPPAVTCDDFATQPAAQAAFNADPVGLAGMDGNGDGLACGQLPGGPQVTPAPPPAPRVPSIEELRVPQERIYGVHTLQAPGYMGEVDAFSAAAKKTPDSVLFFADFSQPYPSEGVAESWARGLLPMVSFEPVLQASAIGQPTLRDIYNGTYDEYLKQWADGTKAQGLPIALRFAHEMNGNWYSWSESTNGNAPGDYILAWRHVHDLFVAEGATNVLWVWSVNRIDTLKNKYISQYYPGADYVDWVGMNGYYRKDVLDQVPSFGATFNMTLGALRTVAPGKPILITETSAGTGETTRVEWIDSFFAGLLANPDIFGFVWFNESKETGCGASGTSPCDWAIQYSSATTEAFANGVADDRYGAGAPTP